MKAKLNDLYRELWLKRRNSGELVWESKNGSIPIKEMTEKYLENAIMATERHECMLDNWADYEANHSDYGERQHDEKHIYCARRKCKRGRK